MILTVFLDLAVVFGAALAALASGFLVSAFLAAGGEPAFAFASFTGPEAPISGKHMSQEYRLLFPGMGT